MDSPKPPVLMENAIAQQIVRAIRAVETTIPIRPWAATALNTSRTDDLPGTTCGPARTVKGSYSALGEWVPCAVDTPLPANGDLD